MRNIQPKQKAPLHSPLIFFVFLFFAILIGFQNVPIAEGFGCPGTTHSGGIETCNQVCAVAGEGCIGMTGCQNGALCWPPGGNCATGCGGGGIECQCSPAKTPCVETHGNVGGGSCSGPNGNFSDACLNDEDVQYYRCWQNGDCESFTSNCSTGVFNSNCPSGLVGVCTSNDCSCWNCATATVYKSVCPLPLPGTNCPGTTHSYTYTPGEPHNISCNRLCGSYGLTCINATQLSGLPCDWGPWTCEISSMTSYTECQCGGPLGNCSDSDNDDCPGILGTCTDAKGTYTDYCDGPPGSPYTHEYSCECYDPSCAPGPYCLMPSGCTTGYCVDRPFQKLNPPGCYTNGAFGGCVFLPSCIVCQAQSVTGNAACASLGLTCVSSTCALGCSGLPAAAGSCGCTATCTGNCSMPTSPIFPSCIVCQAQSVTGNAACASLGLTCVSSTCAFGCSDQPAAAGSCGCTATCTGNCSMPPAACAFSACQNANLAVPCSCGGDIATNSDPWCCASNNKAYSSKSECEAGNCFPACAFTSCENANTTIPCQCGIAMTNANNPYCCSAASLVSDSSETCCRNAGCGVDVDGDGQPSRLCNGTDCDDADPSVFFDASGAKESEISAGTCEDGKDNDCDDKTDRCQDPDCGCAGGIVPCGRHSDDPSTAILEDSTCTPCHLFVLVKKVTDFTLLNVFVPIITIGLIIGGATFLTAGASSPHQILMAKNILKIAGIGTAIVSAAWLIIDTTVTGVVPNSKPWHNWANLACPVPPCNSNGTCETTIDEEAQNCPTDCKCDFDDICEPVNGEQIDGSGGNPEACPDCAVCGDGTVDVEEECDGGNFRGGITSCTGFGYKSGSLGCTNNCRIDFNGCSQ